MARPGRLAFISQSGALAAAASKPILSSFMGAGLVEEGSRMLAQAGVPNFESPEDAVACFNTMARYGRNQSLLAETPASTPGAFRPQTKQARSLVEKMVSKKYELIIGSKRDPLFGPVILFGMGGVGVEVFRDVNVGFPPLNMALAKRLIEGTKIYQLLAGYRGMEAVDLKALQFLLYRFSYLIMDFPEIKEIDINPLAIDPSGCLALDAKVILDPKIRYRKSAPYSHLIISPYPKNWEKRIVSKRKVRALLRPIRPEDEAMEADMFKAMSAETQRFRFFELIKDITHEMLVRYTQIDYDREIAIIAEVEGKGAKKMAGVARIIGDAYNATAEFAVVVADPWQGQGLGNALTDHVLRLARQRRLGIVYAHFLADNRAIRHILEKRGFTTTGDADTLRSELALNT